ncbi:hypothetical protein Leryth_019220 [Lithospermum erythrorhizon]|nr:hypothetical protein Leryth_019220 [Lithospermum erythrorhizon]
MGGGRRSINGGAFNRKALLRHISSCKLPSPTVDQVVDHLLSDYKLHYSRHKRHTLTQYVQKTMQSININSKRPRNFSDVDDREIHMGSEIPQKKKKGSEIKGSNEGNLIKMGPLNNRLIKMGALNDMSSCSSVGEDDEDVSSGDSEVPSSEDEIFSEKFEPKVDLMKDMIRGNYMEKSKGGLKDKGGEDGIELEVVNNNVGKGNKKVDVLKRRKMKMEFESNKGEGDRSGANCGPMFKDLGGMGGVIEELIMEVIVPLYHPQLPQLLGVRPMAGILLHGPPGCGKTKLAHAIANETGVPFYKISATELVSGISGASEENIRELFSKAYRTAPSIVFIDEIDAIASKRENLQREMEKRIVTQLMTSMDESHRQPSDANANTENVNPCPGYILVIGATNRPDSVDPALRRPGRFDREIMLGVPDEAARLDILSKLTDKLKVEGTFDLKKIAKSTPGFVGADLAALTHKAGNLAMKRMFDQRKAALCQDPASGEQSEAWWRQPWSPEEMGKLSITMMDFEEAVKLIQPSSRREGFSAIPNIKWEDVGGLHVLRHELDCHIVKRIKDPDLYADYGIDIEPGFLLYGPPGCGKTLIAKAVANEAGANFIHIKGPELLNKYVGESELAVRTIFSRARTCSPCILFFDEVDALTSMSGMEGGSVVERLLKQLLIELDGGEQRKGVFVIGATNRPEVIDEALLRPGRFGKLLYVRLPNSEERGLILKALGRKKPIDSSVDLMAIAKDTACENLSGADLSALMNDAAMAAVQEEQRTTDITVGSSRTIKDVHFRIALEKIIPSVSDKQRRHYELLTVRYRNSQVQIAACLG